MAALGVGLLLCSPVEAAEGSSALEDKVKAGFVYNFVVHTRWPQEVFPGTADPFVIGLAGDVSFGDLLEGGVKEKTLRGRGITVRRVKTTREAAGCHVLYIGELDKKKEESAYLAAVSGQPTLTVSEDRGFIENGGILYLVKIDGRIRFEVNSKTAQRSGLKLGSQMLKLALQPEKARVAGKN